MDPTFSSVKYFVTKFVDDFCEIAASRSDLTLANSVLVAAAESNSSFVTIFE